MTDLSIYLWALQQTDKQVMVDATDLSEVYVWVANPGTPVGEDGWQLMLIDTSSAIWGKLYPLHPDKFTPTSEAIFNWDDRASYTYDTEDVTPTLETVSISSNNADPTKAKVWDTITLVINPSEDINTPTVTIMGHSVTPTYDSEETEWIAEYTLVSGDTAWAVTFTIDFEDLAENAGDQVTATTDASAVTFDKTAPTAAITYSTANPVKSGASLTITATFSEPLLDSPVVKIALSGSNTLAATNMTKSSTTVYTYVHTVGAGDGAATVALSVGTDASGNVVTAAPTSGATFTVDNTAPTMASGARTNNTTLEVTLSELAAAASITKANDGWFTVEDAVTPATTYAVSAIAPGATNDKVVLTVADVSASQAIGLKIKYAAAGNGTVTDVATNALATNATGVTVAAW